MQCRQHGVVWKSRNECRRRIALEPGVCLFGDKCGLLWVDFRCLHALVLPIGSVIFVVSGPGHKPTASLNASTTKDCCCAVIEG